MGVNRAIDDMVVGTTLAAAVTYTLARAYMPYTLAITVATFSLPATAPLGAAVVATTRRGLSGFRTEAPPCTVSP